VYTQPQVPKWDYKEKEKETRPVIVNTARKKETDDVRRHPSKTQSVDSPRQTNHMRDISYAERDVTRRHNSKKKKTMCTGKSAEARYTTSSKNTYNTMINHCKKNRGRNNHRPTYEYNNNYSSSESEACNPDKNSYENPYEPNNEFSPSPARSSAGSPSEYLEELSGKEPDTVQMACIRDIYHSRIKENDGYNPCMIYKSEPGDGEEPFPNGIYSDEGEHWTYDVQSNECDDPSNCGSPTDHHWREIDPSKTGWSENSEEDNASENTDDLE
jgi:hypothetical protein